MKNFYLAVFGLFSIGAFAQIGNVFPQPSAGQVGIGTLSPTFKLDVVYLLGPSSPNKPKYQYAFFGNRTESGGVNSGLLFEQSVISNKVFSLRSIEDGVNQGYIVFNSAATTNTTDGAVSFGNNSSEFLRINQDGKVRISSTDIATPGDYRLYVEGGILTEKVKVAVEGTGNWADYVFADDYELMPLEEVEQFTKENKHLPNVPCAEDMVTDGLDVAQMDAKLLEKIEELTLYLIEQNKQIEILKAEVKALKQTKE